MTLSRLQRLLLCLGSGLTLALAFPSFNVSPLAWVSVAGLILASAGETPSRAALYGFLHGAVFNVVTLPWIYTVMRVHGGLPVAAAAGVMALLVAEAALFPAAFSLGVARLGRRSVARACVMAPFLWVALEFVRTHMPIIGFPWNLLGYAVSGHLVLLQVTWLAGIHGLSLLVAGVNAWLAYALLTPARGHRRIAGWSLLAGAAVFAPLVAFGERLIPSEVPRHLARLVQTNFPQAPSYPPDWMERHAGEMDEIERLSVAREKGAPELILWPEVPAPFTFFDPKFAARAERVAQKSQDGLLVGIVDWKPGVPGDLLPYNSVALLDAMGRRVFQYDKIHLVAFGEYVPFRRWLTFAGKLTAEVGDFQAGSEYKVGVLPGGAAGKERSFGVFICYEAVFPGEVRRFALNGAGLLVNLSNDGWFGGSAAPAQHLMMARVRAVENRRWLLRSTNTGYTVAVDPYGRYTAQLVPDIRGALDVSYGFRYDLTPYTRWGDWVAWSSIAMAAFFLVWKRRNETNPREQISRRRKRLK